MTDSNGTRLDGPNPDARTATRMFDPVRSAVLIVIALAGPAAAQSSQRTSERIEPGVFHLRQFDAHLELESDFERARVRSENGSGRANARQRNDSFIARELLGFTLSGDIVHPYLIDYSGTVSVGLTQSRFRESIGPTPFQVGAVPGTRTDRPGGFLSEFDLRMNLFKTKPISGTVYGQRGEDRIARLFLPSLRERRTAYGTAWFLRHDNLNLQISYDHTDIDRTGNRDQRDDERLTEDVVRLEADWRISEHQSLKLEYEHSRYQQTFQGSGFDFDTRRDHWRFEHDLAFGDQYQHQLTNVIRFQEESGDLAQDLAEYDVELDLTHTDDLSTHYSYQFSRERLGAIQVDLHRADFQLRHQLFKNLTTTMDLFGLEERTDEDIETTQGGASVAWQYTRNNPYGQLTAGLRLAGDVERTRGGNGLRWVQNEAVTFRDPLPSFLVKADVIRYTIVVTDPTGRTVYRPGSDYTVVPAGNRTALVRNPSGRITNGQTVFVDYRQRTPDRGRIQTTRVDFNIEQAFDNGWRPYYRFGFRHQDVQRTTGFDFLADRTEHHRIGVTLDRDRWSVNGEYEVFGDTIEPYDAFHLTGNWNALREAKQVLDVRGGFSRYFFDGGFDRRNVSELNLGLHHEYQLSQRWSTNVDTSWRWEDDSVRGITNGLDVEGTLAYRRGNLSVEMTMEYDVLSVAGSREDGFGAFMSLRWDFENVLGLN